MEASARFKSDDGTVTGDNHINQWTEYLFEGCTKSGKDGDLNGDKIAPWASAWPF